MIGSSISPIRAGASQVAQMLNERAKNINTSRNSSYLLEKQLLDRMVKDAELEEESVAVEQSSGNSYQVATNRPQADFDQMAQDSIQFKVNTLVDMLQEYADQAELQAYYENLVALGNNDPELQKLNEYAAEYYALSSDGRELETRLDFLMANHLGNTAVFSDNKALLDNLGAMEFLGLSDLANMTAEERRDAFINAIDQVKSRAEQAGYATDKNYVAPTLQELMEKDQSQSRRYEPIGIFDLAKGYDVLSVIALKDALEGNAAAKPILEGKPVDYYETFYYKELYSLLYASKESTGSRLDSNA